MRARRGRGTVETRRRCPSLSRACLDVPRRSGAFPGAATRPHAAGLQGTRARYRGPEGRRDRHGPATLSGTHRGLQGTAGASGRRQMLRGGGARHQGHRPRREHRHELVRLQPRWRHDLGGSADGTVARRSTSSAAARTPSAASRQCTEAHHSPSAAPHRRPPPAVGESSQGRAHRQGPAAVGQGAERDRRGAPSSGTLPAPPRTRAVFPVDAPAARAVRQRPSRGVGLYVERGQRGQGAAASPATATTSSAATGGAATFTGSRPICQAPRARPPAAPRGLVPPGATALPTCACEARPLAAGARSRPILPARGRRPQRRYAIGFWRPASARRRTPSKASRVASDDGRRIPERHRPYAPVFVADPRASVLPYGPPHVPVGPRLVNETTGGVVGRERPRRDARAGRR